MTYQFNEFKQQTTDFTSKAVVEAYDSKQQASIEDGRILAQKLGVKKTDRVIEFGPGTGALSIALAEKCQHVYAVDTSEAMLNFIQKSAKKHNLNNISTYHAGFLSYVHHGQPVDWIVTKYAFHHLPDMWKGVALAKMNRMLGENGRFYLEDVIFSFPPHTYEKAIDQWINQMTQNSGWSREAFEVHVNEEFSTYDWVLERLFQETGFELIEKNRWSDTYTAYLCQKASMR